MISEGFVNLASVWFCFLDKPCIKKMKLSINVI